MYIVYRVVHPHHARGMGGSGQANLNTTYQRLKTDHSVHLPCLQLQVTHWAGLKYKPCENILLILNRSVSACYFDKALISHVDTIYILR